MPDRTPGRLAELLGGDPPEAVRALPDRDLAALADLLADARRRQGEILQAAFTASLKHVPLPLRGVAKKVLLG